jgi:hypothetical protein
MLSRSKLVALLVTGGALVAVGLGATAVSAGPSIATTNGTAYITPGAGNPGTALTVNTNGFCPNGNTNFDVSVTGTGVTTHPLINGNATLPTAGVSGYAAAVTETMGQFASEQSPAANLQGVYFLDFNCFQSSISLSPDYVFAGSMRFKSTGDGTTNNYTNTVTAMAASPSASAPFGAEITFTATLTPPNAAGQVQFTNGTTKLGTPVTVSGGKAVYTTSSLTIGKHSVTATFGPSPTDTSGTWGPSYAVLDYTVTTPAPVFLPVVYGKAKVGLTVSCIEAVEYQTSKSWSWYDNGVQISDATTASYKIPAALLGKSLACRLAATDSAGATAETSPAVKVGAA